MGRKHSLNDLYDTSKFIIDFGKEVCSFSKTKIYPPHYCAKCGTELHQIYMENRVYLVTCPWCDTVTLVEAVSPINALMKVGITDGQKWIPIKRTWPTKKGRYLVTYREWSNGEFLPEYDETYVRILRFAEAIFQLPRCIDPRAEADTNREVIAWMPLPERYEDYEDGI